MAYGKHRFYAKWRSTALTVGFLTIIVVASAHAQGSIYWTEGAPSNKIRRATPDGSIIVDHVTGLDTPSGIALDLDRIPCFGPLRLRPSGCL